MQALVADVPAYPRFLPWVKAARVWGRKTDPDGVDGHVHFNGELVVGFQAFRGQFATTVEVVPGPRQIRTRLLRGPFRQLACIWAFRDSDSGCLPPCCARRWTARFAGWCRPSQTRPNGATALPVEQSRRVWRGMPWKGPLA
jgi:hypothetical protein